MFVQDTFRRLVPFGYYAITSGISDAFNPQSVSKVILRVLCRFVEDIVYQYLSTARHKGMYQQRFGAAFQPVKLPKISQYTETSFIQNSSLSTMVTRKTFRLI